MIRKSQVKRILLLLVILVSFTFSFILSNPNLNRNKDTEDKMVEVPNFNDNSIKAQGLSLDNTYSGVGAPWNVSHYANTTDTGVANFGNNSYQLLGIQSGFGWTGYKLKASITDLYDERQWINGTMTYGNDDGDYNANSDDSTQIQDWDFFETDVGGANDMSGNYMDSAAPDSGGQDCLELRLDGRFVDATHESYDANDRCRWEYSTTIPRGNVVDSTLSLQLRPTHLSQVNSWVIYIYINNVFIASRDIIALNDIGIENWGKVVLPQETWANISNVFSGPLYSTTTEIDIEFRHVSGGTVTYGPEDGPNIDYQQVLVDNIELYVRADAQPTQVNLEMNQTAVSNIDYGSGTIELTGNWNGTEAPYVYGNFSSIGQGVYAGGYNLDFNADMNLNAIKQDQPTNYEADAASIGTSFTVSNNSYVDWECYSGIAVPTGYEETTMRIQFPSDVNISWISSAIQPSVNVLTQCDNSTAGVLIVPVADIVGIGTANGFWKLIAKSTNYLEQLNIYNNATGSWVLNHEFLSGEYINITAKITNTPQISSYIQQTNAYLNIRFPNGSLWQNQIQAKSPDANGYIDFDVFQIPITPPDYEIGEYEVIITWNNSYSIYGMNETGIIYKKFNVAHYSSLTPEQTYFDDITEDSIINLKVSFNDRENNDAIENAEIYVYNFTNPSIMQNFNEISPGLYLLEFNVSGGNAGDNNITIYANSSQYVNNEVNVTIHVILETTLTVNQTILTLPWNSNFSIQFNYTEATTGSGITTTPSHNWIGEANLVSTAQGIYYLTCNTSSAIINQQYSLKIDANQVGYESQTILIYVDITKRATIVEDIQINQTAQTQIIDYYGEMLNITFKYTDIVSNTLIDTNEVELRKGVAVIGSFTKLPIYDFYNFTLNTSILELDINVLTIYANKDNYFAAFESITITLNERDTYLVALVNNDPTSSFSIYNISIGEYLNITTWYRDNMSLGDPNINFATIELIGMGVPKSIDKHNIFDQYTISVFADDLGLGVSILTISAQKQGYSSISEGIAISVSERKTNLTLFVNGTILGEGAKYEVEVDHLINITVTFRDYLPPYSHLKNSSIDLLGFGSLSNQTALEQYNITISANDLGQGENILTIFAQKEDHQAQTIYFIIAIIDKNTTLQLFLNGTPSLDFELELYADQSLNITLVYRDESGNFVENATMELGGEGLPTVNLTQNKILEHYNITLEAYKLGKGRNILTLFADKSSYEYQSIKLTINIIDKPTNMYIFIETENRTLNPSYEIPLGDTLNITVIYFDNNTIERLINATVELRSGGTLLGTFTRTGQRYTLILITAGILDIGLRTLSVSAQQDNYTEVSANIFVTVRRIEGRIEPEDGEKIIIAEPGENVRIRVVLKNKDFGGKVKDEATVKYTWEEGQGELEETSEEGVYEIVLENVPEGTYSITITVYAGDDYDFKRLKITLIVETPEDVAFMYQLLTVIAIGFAIGIGSYLIVYQKVLKYPKPVRKVRKFRRRFTRNKAPKVEITSRKEAFERLFKSELDKFGSLLKSKASMKIASTDEVIKKPLELSSNE